MKGQVFNTKEILFKEVKEFVLLYGAKVVANNFALSYNCSGRTVPKLKNETRQRNHDNTHKCSCTWQIKWFWFDKRVKQEVAITHVQPYHSMPYDPGPHQYMRAMTVSGDNIHLMFLKIC